MKKLLFILILTISQQLYSQTIDNIVDARIDTKTKPLVDTTKALRKDIGAIVFDTVILKPMNFTGSKNLDTLLCPNNSRQSFSLKLSGEKISCIRVVTIRNVNGTYSVINTGYIPGATLSAPSGVAFSANASSTRGVIISISGVPSATSFNYERQITRQ